MYRSIANAIAFTTDVKERVRITPAIYVEYHRRSAVVLVTSLEDPSERHQSVTMHLLTHQVAKLKALATTFLSTREGTSLPIKRQLNLPTYASTSTCLHPRQQAPLSLERNQHIFRRSQAQKSPPPESPPPNISHPHQLHYQTAYGPRHNWLP